MRALLTETNDGLASVAENFMAEEKKGVPKILVVEDNEINIRVAIATLKKLGYQSDIATDGAEAVKVVSSGEAAYQLILMDCHMPNMNGYEATQAIRAMSGDSAKTPIVAMTAGAMVGDREKCIEAGMDDYLSKPLRRELLKQVLEKWVD